MGWMKSLSLALLTLLATPSHAMWFNFGRSELLKEVKKSKIEQLVQEFKDEASYCCKAYSLHCSFKVEWSYSALPVKTKGKTTGEVLASLKRDIAVPRGAGSGTRVLLSAYKGFVLGSSNRNGIALYKRGDGFVLAHELGHVNGWRDPNGEQHSPHSGNLMAPGDVAALDAKPDRLWCSLLK